MPILMKFYVSCCMINSTFHKIEGLTLPLCPLSACRYCYGFRQLPFVVLQSLYFLQPPEQALDTACVESDISWPLDESDTDAVLAEKFFPSANQVTSNKRMPDYDYIRKELLRNGVSKKLLWTEYMEDCRVNGDEPLMYSQFCYCSHLISVRHRN